jgi:hypothetical protein
MNSNPSGYLTAVDIPESAVWNATTQTVSANSAQWAGGTANPQIPVTGINGIKISESGDKVVFEVSADYYPGNNPSGFITGVDLSDYATTAQVAEKQDITGMTAYQPVGNYQTAGDYLTTADSANFYTTANESGFITGVDLAPYQEKADMTAYATVESLTAKQDAGDYLSATDSANFLLTSDSGNFYTTANESGFITGVDLTPYQLTADMTAYQPVGDYLTTGDSVNFYPMTGNPSGFINELPEEEEVEFEEVDLAAYQPSGDYYSASNPSGFISEVPAGTMNESAFEYDANDKISGYNGSAFAGGSDVPEGVMVESGLEYNAVNEISGYNGSAIAQYGAEKQWLVHDDTLVHASNSAQYALGVNLSAVAQLLGVDETVLFEHNDATVNVSSADLSENLSAFSKVKIYYSTISDHCYGCNEFEISAMGLTDAIQGFGNNGPVIRLVQFNIQDTNISVNRTIGINFANFGTTPSYRVNHADDMKAINKVVGIGRKA